MMPEPEFYCCLATIKRAVCISRAASEYVCVLFMCDPASYKLYALALSAGGERLIIIRFYGAARRVAFYTIITER